MRSDACGLLELPREMKYRQSRNGSELCEIDGLAKVCLYMFAHPMHGARRETAARLRDRHYLLQTGKQIQARACVQSGSYGVCQARETLFGGVTSAGQTSSLSPMTRSRVSSPGSRPGPREAIPVSS